MGMPRLGGGAAQAEGLSGLWVGQEPFLAGPGQSPQGTAGLASEPRKTDFLEVPR